VPPGLAPLSRAPLPRAPPPPRRRWLCTLLLLLLLCVLALLLLLLLLLRHAPPAAASAARRGRAPPPEVQRCVASSSPAALAALVPDTPVWAEWAASLADELAAPRHAFVHEKASVGAAHAADSACFVRMYVCLCDARCSGERR
jgi:hypothetical protein